MPILTLTTDWGLRDTYVAVFKGLLLRQIPDITLIDISHQIHVHDKLSAAHVLQNSYPHFPPGSIHYMGLHPTDPGFRKDPRYLLIRTQGQYLLGADNGIFSMILPENDREVWRLPIDRVLSLDELQQFMIGTIVQLVRGIPPDQLGDPNPELTISLVSHPQGDPTGIRGNARYVDHFGNIVFNITREFFESHRKGRPFTILLRRANYRITSLSINYHDVPEGDYLAIFNQDGYLEVAINAANASQLLGLKVMDPVLIEFHDHTIG